MKTYTGGCHCGAVQFEVDADINKVLACNCSRCLKLGSVLAFAPKTSFRLIKGIDNLTEYFFNKRVISHLFCRTCGVQPFAFATAPDGTDTAAVNVRCLNDVDPESFEVQKFDGKSV